MTQRDWTPSDAADAADADRARKWWRRDSAIGPWEDEAPEWQCNDCGGTDCQICEAEWRAALDETDPAESSADVGGRLTATRSRQRTPSESPPSRLGDSA